MALRDALNRNPAITTAATIVLILLTLGTIIWMTVDRSRSTPTPTAMIYFSIDDGANFIAGPADQRFVSQPTVDGKPALVAHVFTCDGNTRFVGYLERFTPDAAAKAAELAKSGPRRRGPIREDPVIAAGREVKRPKESRWIRASSPEGEAVAAVKCPDGSFAIETLPDVPQ